MSVVGGTCKDCKWWGRDFKGVCDFPDAIYDPLDDVRFEIVCSAYDDQGLEAFLHTGRNFGCTHFKEGGSDGAS